MHDKRRIEVEISYTEDLSQVAIDVFSPDGTALSGQDLIDCIAEAILLKYDYYDLDTKPELDG